VSKRLQEIQQESRAGAGLDGLLQEQAEKRSRLNLLEQLQAEHEGSAPARWPRCSGPNKCSVRWRPHSRARRYVAAVETASVSLQLVLTKRPESRRKSSPN